MSLKKYLLMFAMASTSSLAMATPNVTPSIGLDRQKIDCFGSLFRSGNQYSHDYKMSFVIDWQGNTGDAFVTILRRQLRGYRILSQSQQVVELFQTPYLEQIRSLQPSTLQNLLITWRSDLGDDVPVEHFIVAGGIRYPITYCQANLN